MKEKKPKLCRLCNRGIINKLKHSWYCKECAAKIIKIRIKILSCANNIKYKFPELKIQVNIDIKRKEV